MAPFLELPASSSDAQADLGTSNKAVLRVFECCYMILAALTARLRTPAVLARLSTSGLVTAQNGNRNHGGRAPTPCAPSKLTVFCCCKSHHGKRQGPFAYCVDRDKIES